MYTTLLYILKSYCFFVTFTSVTPSVYIARSYAATMSLFWSEQQHTLSTWVTRGVYIIISFNIFEIFIHDRTMSRLTIYFSLNTEILNSRFIANCKSFFLPAKTKFKAWNILKEINKEFT